MSAVGFGSRTELPARWREGGLIDPVSGLLGGVWEQPRLAGHADIFQYAGIAANTGAFGMPENFRHVGGASLDRAAAFAKAVGEGVERYCAAIYDPEAHPLVSAQDAPFDTIDPDLLALYPPEFAERPGFEFHPISKSTPILWVKARRLAGGETHAPAALVYVPWFFEPDHGEPAFCQPISTGLACHQTLEQAVLGGLMEVVERDAFTLAWQSQSPLLRLSRDGLPDDCDELARRIEATGARIRLGFASMEHGVPTCIAAQEIDSGDMPAFALAAASSPSPATAVRKALEELAHTFRWMCRLMRANPPLETQADFANVVDQETHLRFWCLIERREMASFLWSGDREAQLSDIADLSTGAAADDVTRIAARLAREGVDPCYVELTTPDAAHFGFHVVRVIAPGMNPLFMGHDLRSRTNPRLLKRLAERAEQTGLSPDALNTLPHPFP